MAHLPIQSLSRLHHELNVLAPGPRVDRFGMADQGDYHPYLTKIIEDRRRDSVDAGNRRGVDCPVAQLPNSFAGPRSAGRYAAKTNPVAVPVKE